MNKILFSLAILLLLFSPVFAQDLQEFVTANFNTIVTLGLFLILFAAFFPAAASLSENVAAQFIIATSLAGIIALFNFTTPVFSQAVQLIFTIPYGLVLLLIVLIVLNLIVEYNKGVKIAVTAVLVVLLIAYLFSQNLLALSAGGQVQEASSTQSIITYVIIGVIFVVLAVFGFMKARDVGGDSYSSASSRKRSPFSKGAEKEVKDVKPGKEVQKVRQTLWEDELKKQNVSSSGDINEYTKLLSSYQNGKISKQEINFIKDLHDLENSPNIKDKTFLKFDKNKDELTKLLENTKGLMQKGGRENVLNFYWKIKLVTKELLGINKTFSSWKEMSSYLGYLNTEKQRMQELLDGVKI